MRAELVLQSADAGLLDPQQCRAALCRTAGSTPNREVGSRVGHTVPQDGNGRRRVQMRRGAIAHTQPSIAAFRDVEAHTAVRAEDFAEIRHQRGVGIGHRLVPPLAELSLVGPDLHVERAGVAIGIGDLDGRIRADRLGGRRRTSFVGLAVAVVVDLVATLLGHAGIDVRIVVIAVTGLRTRVRVAVAVLVVVDARLGAVVDGGIGVGAGRSVRAGTDGVDASSAGVFVVTEVHGRRTASGGGDAEGEQDTKKHEMLDHLGTPVGR